MSRLLHVGAAQVGPLYKDEPREETVERSIALLEEAGQAQGRTGVLSRVCLIDVFP